MKIVNGIAHIDEKSADLRVIDVEILDGLYLKIEFSNGEKRIFNAKQLLNYPVYKKLEDETIFHSVSIKNGTLVWDNERIDIGTDFLYENSKMVKQN